MRHAHGLTSGALTLLVAALGCNTGSRDGSGKFSYGPGSTGAGVASGSTAAGSTPAGLAIVALPGELLSGAPPTEVVVFLSDDTLTDARLLVDTGSGYVDTGAQLLRAAGQPPMFTTGAASRGAKLQVLARQGASRVSSNEVTVGAFQLDGIRISAPAGDYTGFPNLIPPPDSARWDAINGVQRYLVILRDATTFEWVATIGTNAYTWGEPYATHFFEAGTRPLPSGRYRLTVCALDATGWATRGSERRAGAATVPYVFEVQ